MAAKYRKIDPRIWDDEVFDNLTGPDCLCALFLTTFRGVNRAGVAIVGLGEASDKLRLQGVDEAWDTLSRVCLSFNWPLQKVGRNTVVIILRSWFRYNEPTNQDHLAGMLSDLKDVPRCELVSGYPETVKPYLDEKWHGAFDRLYHSLSTDLLDTLPHRLASPEAEAEAGTEAEAEAETETPPKSPKGEKGRVASKRGKDKSLTDFPEVLDTPEFRAAWAAWEVHRVEKKSKLTPSTVEMQIKMLAELGVTKAVETIEHSIKNGWIGLFSPDDTRSSGKSKPVPKYGGVGKF